MMRTSDQPIRISLFAPNGRMGRAIVAAVEADPAVTFDQDHGDVLIDFSSPAGLRQSLDRAISAGIPLLVGTTGLIEEHQSLIADAAKIVPILSAANTSLGVTLLAYLVREAASRLGEDWDIEVVETHHRMKVDAPSGTALLLGQAAADGRGVDLAERSARGRDGETGARRPGDIGFASLRGGTVPGEHMVHFLGPNERISLGHLAEDRTIFAQGAIRAARWLVGKPAGLYSMSDVLAL